MVSVLTVFVKFVYFSSFFYLLCDFSIRLHSFKPINPRVSKVKNSCRRPGPQPILVELIIPLILQYPI